MKKTLLLLLTLMCSVGMWAEDPTKSFKWEATDTYTVSNNSFTADGVTWTFSGSNKTGSPTLPTTGVKSYERYGLKFGNSGSAYYGTVSFSTGYFKDVNVKSVKMTMRNNGSKIGTLTATQGATQIGTATQAAASSSWDELTATGTTGNKGTLVVTYEVAQASYIESITVTYEVPSAPTVAYTVTFNANTNGTCLTASLTEASAGAGVTLPSCTPNANYGFVGWATTNDATSANAGKANDTYYPTANCTLYAVYANLYTVTIETPANGTLVVKNGETVVNSGDQVANGTTLNITATPNRGYAFRNWQAVDATTHTYTTTFTYDVASDVTIKANFDQLAKYTVTLADDNTELTPEYGGEAVVLPSRAAIGAYTFAGWSETNVAEETTTSPTIIEAGAYVAAADVTLYPVYTRSEAGGDTDVPVSIKIADNLPTGTASGDKVKSFTIDENVTATSTGGESNSSKIYGSPLSQWRFYRTDEGAMTITTTAGTLKSVTVTYSVDKNGVMLHGTDEIASGTAVENINATSITFTAGGGETGKTNGVIRITDIAVVYTIDGQTTYYWSSPSVAPTSTDITISSAGWATYYTDKEFTMPEGLEGYYVSYSTDESAIELVQMYGGNEETTVPANEPLLLKGKAKTYTLVYSNTDATAYLADANLLHGNLTAGMIPAVDGMGKYYKLYNGTTNGIGWYWGEENGGRFTMGANKAYLALPASFGAAKSSFAIDFSDETTGINAIKNVNENDNVIYNLNGMRVNNAMKGVYIKNGKKFINK